MSEKESLFQYKVILKHEENVVKKQIEIDQAREMFKSGFSMKAIAREMKIDKRTVKTYLDLNHSAVHASFGEKSKVY
jgi:DNA-binding NarL/FixJ family response regulator